MLVLARPEGIALVLLLLALVAYRRVLHWQWGVPLGGVRVPSSTVSLVYGGGRGVWGRGQMALCRTARVIARADPMPSSSTSPNSSKGFSPGRLGHQTSVNLYAYDGNYRRMVFAPFVALLLF